MKLRAPTTIWMVLLLAQGCGGDNGDLCERVTCDDPRANTCKDADTLLEYPATGTCSADTGECAYTPSEKNCENGCSNGACLGNGGPPSFALSDLGVLGDGTESVATGLNDHRVVVGWSTVDAAIECVSIDGLSSGPDRGCRHGFRFEAGAMSQLAELPGHHESEANDINNDGVIVGTSHINDTTQPIGTLTHFGAVWEGPNSPLKLADLRPDDDRILGGTFAVAINEAGQVAGRSSVFDEYLGFPTSRATVWSQVDGWAIREIGSAHPQVEIAHASGISENGHVVGTGFLFLQNGHAVTTNDNGELVALDETMSPSHQRWAYARDLSGRIVGETNFGFGEPQAAVWTQDPGGKWQAPQSLLPVNDYPFSSATAMNERGEVVGVARGADNRFIGFLVDLESSSHWDLNELLRDELDVIGATIIEARGINVDGDIAGTIEIDGTTHAVLLERQRP